MKTSVNTGEVSLPPARTAGWSVNPPAQQCYGSEKQVIGVEKGLDKPSDGRKIATTTHKSHFNTVNINSNGKSRAEASI
jgi:hypothetical protein